MVFSSLTFLSIFLPVVFGLHLIIPSLLGKNILLIIASLLFYAYGEPIYVLLMIGSTIVNYVAGRLLGRFGKNRAVLAAAVIANLGMLVVFKYSAMVVDFVNGLLGTAIPVPELALPIGISFFTFQALSYVIDVYRGDVPAERNYLDVLLYISFFPQLIAGPIVKYHDIAAQIRDRRVTAAATAKGLRRFCIGLGKKVLIANNCAVAVDWLFAQAPGDLNVIAAWTAALAYLLQIYFDFSGYSDMAIGMGHMFGFTIKENFNYPYVSTSIREFWRRWHISLSTWFKEYLYIPLGGNRRGAARTMLNRVIVFFLCGLWHGASWTFVVWGLLHGAFMIFETAVPVKKMPRAIGHIYALLVVCLTFVIFRADTLGQGFAIIGQMFCGWNFDNAAMVIALRQLTPVFLLAFTAGAIGAFPVREVAARWLGRQRAALSHGGRALAYGASVLVLALCFLALSSGAYNPFIYFRF